MTFIKSGSTVIQSSVDVNPSGLSSIAGVTAPARGNLYATADNLAVSGQLSVPKETLQIATIFAYGSTAILTIGSDDGNLVSGGTIYIQNPTIGFTSGALYATNGATISLNNTNIIVAAGGGGAEIGAYLSSWILNAKNVNFIKIGSTKGWHYIGGGGVLSNVSWRNALCVFFQASPLIAEKLKLTNVDWGIGIDGYNINVTIKKSSIPRAMIQRSSNTLNLYDVQMTDWVACREESSPTTSCFKFFRTLNVKAVGNNQSQRFVLWDNVNSILINQTTDSAGNVADIAIQWGEVPHPPANYNPDILTDKVVASQIVSNPSVHRTGAYKMPLIAQFATYNSVLSTQVISQFDITQADAVNAFSLSPNIIVDNNVTLSETNAVAKLASSFNVNIGTNTITVTALSTLDDLYDVMKAFKTRNVKAQLEYPSIGTQPVVASGDTLITAMSIVGLEFLTGGAKFKKIQANGTANGAFANFSIVGDVTQNTPSSLTNVSISGTLTYNTNVAAVIMITNCTLNTVVNNGTGIITINKINASRANYVDAEINFIDSTIAVVGADVVTFHPSANDRDLNQNASGSFTGSYAFKFGSVQNGSTMSGTLYLRCVAGGIPFNVNRDIVVGDNLLDLGTTAQLASLSSKIDLAAKEATVQAVKSNTDLIPAVL
ncbi:hypothetical protein [Lacihabitans soyangensis]|uniref:Uncharacterized protein n=1 Tax=Lacihabitans soyangensis TaxID=869394 RepID=A0AAE3H5J1_9BACT|nr:hypothetical protein [Lacihabitans soyangensis]MCP9765153.1 hypothetical protein [Lacihabitans soyangensis]